MTAPDSSYPASDTTPAPTPAPSVVPPAITPVDFAIDYVRRGWPVMPVHCPISNERGTRCSCGADCKSPAKHPATRNGLKDATLDEVMVDLWFTTGPIPPNVGVRTGRTPEGGGFIVLDIDPRNNGDKSLAALEAEHGPLPATPTEKTGGGGLHYLFEHPTPNVSIKNITGLWPGIDIKADGGYLVVAPSRHKSGGDYEWLPGRTPADVALASAPQWLLDAIDQKSKTKVASSATQSSAQAASPGATVPEGGRNSHLTSLAGSLRHRGCEEDVVLAALLTENKTRCAPPLDDAEVQSIAASVCRYPAGQPHIASRVAAAQTEEPSDEEIVASWEIRGTADVLGDLEASWTRGDVVTKTGLASLDDLLGGGLRQGNVVAIAGAAGSSKSAFVGQVGYDAAAAGALVVIASVEMPPEEIHARWIALELLRQASPDAWAMRFGDVFRGRAHRGECALDVAANMEIWRRLDAATAAIQTRTTLFVKQVPPGTTPSMLNLYVKRVREQEPEKPVVLIVDPVQRLYASESGKRRGRALDSINSVETERVGAVAQELKHMADTEGLAVIFTSDTTKSAVLNNTSSATSLRGSYELNHLATTVLGTYSGESPEEVHAKLKAGDVSKTMAVEDIKKALPIWWGTRSDVAQLGPRVVVLECSKNRQGPQRSLALGFIGGAMAFVERERTPQTNVGRTAKEALRVSSR